VLDSRPERRQSNRPVVRCPSCECVVSEMTMFRTSLLVFYRCLFCDHFWWTENGLSPAAPGAPSPPVGRQVAESD
jgi:hypothetical protein